jgi:hypothetical protein
LHRVIRPVQAALDCTTVCDDACLQIHGWYTAAEPTLTPSLFPTGIPSVAPTWEPSPNPNSATEVECSHPHPIDHCRRLRDFVRILFSEV